MQDDSSYSPLTPNGLHLLLRNGESRILLQILSLRKLFGEESPKAYYKGLVSDGQHKASVTFQNQAYHALERIDTPLYCVICVISLLQRDQEILIQEIEIIYQDMEHVIGDPSEYYELNMRFLNVQSDNNTDRLSQNGINSLLAGETNIILQVLYSEELTQAESGLEYKIVLSDGSMQHEALLKENGAKTFKMASTSLNCLIKVTDAMIQGYHINPNVMITEIEIVKNTTDVIQKPQGTQQVSGTSLTKNGIESLLKGKGGLVLQVLSGNKIMSKPKQSYQAILSDGFVKYQVLLKNNAADVLETIFKEHERRRHQEQLGAIVRVLDPVVRSGMNNQKVVMITEMSITNPYISDVIGNPIEYNEWLNNNRRNETGDNIVSTVPNIIPNATYNKFKHPLSTIETTNETTAISKDEETKQAETASLESLEEECIDFDRVIPTHSFIVKARVTAKTKLKFKYKRGRPHKNKQQFFAQLTDKQGNSSQACFTGESAPHYFKLLELNGVYIMGGGFFEPIDKDTLEKKEPHIIFNTNNPLTVLRVQDEDDFPLTFDIVPLNKIAESKIDILVDVEGFIVAAYEPIQVILKRNFEHITKRQVTIADESNTQIDLIFMNPSEKNLQLREGEFITVKSARLIEQRGIRMLLACQEARVLKNQIDSSKYLELKENIVLKTMTVKYSTIEEVKAGGSESFVVIASVEDIMTGTEQRDLNFKINRPRCRFCGIITRPTTEFCLECGSMNIDRIHFKFGILLKIRDQTGSLAVSARNDVAQIIFQRRSRTVVKAEKKERQQMFEEALGKEYKFGLVFTKEGIKASWIEKIL